MKASSVILIGCGAQAKYALDIFGLTGRTVSRLLDPMGAKVGMRIGNHTIESAGTFLDSLKSHGKGDSGDDGLVCLSDNRSKAIYFREMENYFNITDAIHPDCTISATARLSAGVIVNARAVIQHFASIGKGCMIHAGVVVEHDTTVGDFVNMAPGVILAGGVGVGEGTTIYSGAVVTPNVIIGKYSIIGAGSTVLHDIPDHVVAHGAPAKPIRDLPR